MKLTAPIALALVLALAACAAPATPEPTATPLPPPTETPIPPTPTLEPTPTPDPLLFRDDFEGALGEGWHFLHERTRDWSLTAEPGWLEIKAAAGGLGDGSMRNVLLRDAPAGDYQLDTHLNFRPAGNFQIAGLLIYADDGNTVVFGRAFCAGGTNCVGDGLYMDLNIGGQWQNENYGTKAPDLDSLYLRLRRVGDAYSGLVSEDGEHWTLLGQHRASWQPVFVGLVAGQAVGTVPGRARFDYFTLTALP